MNSPIDLKKLNANEIATLKLFKKGYTNKEIADALGLKEKGVKYRFTQIYRKLNVTDDAYNTFHKGKILLIKLFDCKEI